MRLLPHRDGEDEDERRDVRRPEADLQRREELRERDQEEVQVEEVLELVVERARHEGEQRVLRVDDHVARVAARRRPRRVQPDAPRLGPVHAAQPPQRAPARVGVAEPAAIGRGGCGGGRCAELLVGHVGRDAFADAAHRWCGCDGRSGGRRLRERRAAAWRCRGERQQGGLRALSQASTGARPAGGGSHAVVKRGRAYWAWAEWVGPAWAKLREAGARQEERGGAEHQQGASGHAGESRLRCGAFCQSGQKNGDAIWRWRKSLLT